MRTLLLLLLTTMVMAFSSGQAQATIIDTGSGFEVMYEFNLRAGTLHGNDVTDIFVLETDGTHVSVDYAFTAPAQGASAISHVIPFEPTLALILGLDLAIPGVGDEKNHIIVFMDNSFYKDNLGGKFSEFFPAVGGGERVGHNALIAAMWDAQGGDADAITLMTDFFMTGAGAAAAFDPSGPFRVIEFTIEVPIDVPEPFTVILIGSGLIGFGLLRKQFKK